MIQKKFMWFMNESNNAITNNLLSYLYRAILFFILGFITLAIQLNIPMHNDNVFFLHAAKMLLRGGDYIHDFLDTNPPLIIFLNLPVAWIAQNTLLHKMYVFYFYILFYAFGSLALSCYLLKQIIHERSYFYVITATLSIVLLIFPHSSFGQREHLFVIFTLPYLFSAAARLYNKKIHILLAILIGIFAGIGFALKPYFLFTFILLEMFFIYKKRNIHAWIRPESLCVLGVIIAYLWAVYYFLPDYIHTILPLLFKYYFIHDWRLVIVNPFVIYSILIFGLYGITWKRWAYPNLSQILMLANLGCLLSFLSAHILVFYHALPMLSISMLLASLLLVELAKRLYSSQITLSEILNYFLAWLSGIIAITFMLPIEKFYYLHVRPDQLPLTVLALLSFVFFSLTLQKIVKEPVIQFFVLLIFILMLVFSAHPFIQPDQLYLILILPYLCVTLLRLYNQPLNHFISLLIGITLGIAVCLNYNLIVPIFLTECFFFLQNKSFISNLKIELLSSLLIAYGLSHGIFHPILKFTGLDIHWLNNIESTTGLLPLQQNYDFLYLFSFFFCGFFLLMHVIFYQRTKYFLMNNLFCFVCVGFIIYALAEKSQQNIYATLPAIIIASLLGTSILMDMVTTKFPGLTNNKIFLNTGKVLTLSFACAFLFFFPFKYLTTNMLESSNELKNGPLSSLVSYLNAYPHSTFDFYALDDSLLALDIKYDHHFVGQSPMLWWYLAISKNLANRKNKSNAINAVSDEEFFINGLANQLDRTKPRFVITEMDRITPNDFIKVFSTNFLFKKAWSCYRFKTNVNYNSDKFFMVYERT